MESVQLKNQKIYYSYFEKENPKSVILILHWRWGSSNSREDVAKGLNNAGYTVIVPDLPWFWETDINEEYSVQKYASTIEEFLHTLSKNVKDIWKKIILLWHSNWWRISIQLAVNKNIKIRKLILNNSAGIVHKPTIKQQLFNIMAKILKMFSFVPSYKLVRSYLYRFIGGHDYLNAKNPYLKKTFINVLKTDLQNEMLKINVPTDLIRWEDDTYTPIRDGERVHQLIQNSTLAILSWEKHGIHLHNPSLLIETILKKI